MTSCTKAYNVGGEQYWSHNGTQYAVYGRRALCLDEHAAPPRFTCVVYSIGDRHRGGESSFEEVMQFYSCRVVVLRQHDSSSNTIGSSNKRMNLIHGHKMSPDEVLLSLPAGEMVDYLVVDLLGDDDREEPMLRRLVDTGFLRSRVRQLNVALHFDDADEDFALEKYRRKAALLRAIESQGMVRFDSKKHLRLGDNVESSKSYEVTWYNARRLLVPS